MLICISYSYNKNTKTMPPYQHFSNNTPTISLTHLLIPHDIMMVLAAGMGHPHWGMGLFPASVRRHAGTLLPIFLGH